MATATPAVGDSLGYPVPVVPTVMATADLGRWTVRHPTAIPWLYLGAITIAEIETGLLSIPVGLHGIGEITTGRNGKGGRQIGVRADGGMERRRRHDERQCQRDQDKGVSK